MKQRALGGCNPVRSCFFFVEGVAYGGERQLCAYNANLRWLFENVTRWVLERQEVLVAPVMMNGGRASPSSAPLFEDFETSPVSWMDVVSRCR